MERIVWTPRPLGTGGGIAPPEGLTALLRTIDLGQRVLVPGRTSNDVKDAMRTARRGASSRWFESRTLTVGVEIRRIE